MKTIILLVVIMLLTSPTFGGSITLLARRTMDISVGQYRSLRFVLPEHQADSARLVGFLGVVPDSSSVELILLHVDDYLRWRTTGASVDTLGYTKTPSGSFDMEIPGFGSLVLIISNRGNFVPVSVLMSVDVHFAGSGNIGDPLPAALRLALILMMAGAIAVAVGGVIARIVIARRTKT